jgi:deoxyribodipyrimidine photolyase-related protein
VKAALILDNQLLEEHPAMTDKDIDVIIMIEAQDTYQILPYHSHKLILLLSAMRHFRSQVETKGKKIIYEMLGQTPSFNQSLKRIIEENNITVLSWMKSSDVAPNQTLIELTNELKINHEIYPNGMFLTPESELRDWFSRQKSPLMENFYHWQRQRTGILMDRGKPLGGRWNYDAENRRPLPKNGLTTPALLFPVHDDLTKQVIDDVSSYFPTHPGIANDFWLPVTHIEAAQWLRSFVNERFSQFGPYEDAMKDGESFLFHSVLSPLINCGLLSVSQVVDAALTAYTSNDIPIESVEGFIRQLIGWREYMYGLYLSEPIMISQNYFGFSKQLEDWWYTADGLTQDLPLPVISALRTVQTYGYNHHIERLMILGNWFLLNEYDPQSVYRWFSSMYVDAYEWVMVPNVIGMSQYADGGRTATKPYISGGNYLQKMGRWWPNAVDAKDSQFTLLYWQFLQNNHEKLQSNFRMSLALKQAQSRHMMS